MNAYIPTGKTIPVFEDMLEQYATEQRDAGAGEERRFFEPEVKLTKFLRKEGHNNLALWIETQNEKYLELSLGLPVGSLDKFEREALTLPTK